MKRVVVDTNVAVVANGDSEGVAIACQLNCVRFLREVVASGTVHIDDRRIILSQYRRYLSFRGEPGVGDAFYRHLSDHFGNEALVAVVSVTPTDDEWQFAEFPKDERLREFDKSDRIFVAVALAAPNASIANAVDSDWDDFHEALYSHGVTILQLCPA